MRAFLAPFFLAALVAPSDAEVRAQTLDGVRLAGGEPAFLLRGRRLRLGGELVATADLDWLAAAEPRPLAADGSPGLVLRDGSWLPVASISAAGRDRVRAQGPLGEIALPLEAIVAWGPAALLDEPPGDDDRVVLANGSRVAGRLVGLLDGSLHLQTTLAPEPVALALAEVVGVRLAVRVREPEGLHLAARPIEDRPPVFLAPAWPPALAVAPDTALDPARLGRLEVRGGRRVFLDRLPPATIEEQGAFGVVWPYRVGENLDGTPLRLAGRRYRRALVVHSQARLAWRLDGAYQRFQATLGIADIVAGVGDCAVRIEGDGRVLWQRDSITGRSPPIRVALELGGVDELALVVEPGQRHDIGDHLVVAEPWLVRRAKP